MDDIIQACDTLLTTGLLTPCAETKYSSFPALPCLTHVSERSLKRAVSKPRSPVLTALKDQLPRALITAPSAANRAAAARSFARLQYEAWAKA